MILWVCLSVCVACTPTTLPILATSSLHLAARDASESMLFSPCQLLRQPPLRLPDQVHLSHNCGFV
eukprot:4640649-Amphidinium_carterae.1